VSLLEGNALHFKYDGNEDWVINDLDFSADPKEMVAVIGPNGSGKSTLLKLLTGILRPQRGEVRLRGRPLKDYSRREVSRNMALVAQEGMGDFPFTVLDVVLMGRAPYLKGFALEGKGDMERAMWAVDVTDLAKLYRRNIQELSGGERQRAFVARALAQDTGLLFLDEPTAFLDIKHQISLLKLIGELNTRYKKTIVSVTHDINLASYFYDRIILLSEGKVFASGTPEEVITEGNMREVYDTEITVDINPVFKRPRITISGGLMK